MAAHRSTILACLALLLTIGAGLATAQSVAVNGVIEATIDGEARRWTTLFVADSDEGAQSSASFYDGGFGMLDLTVQGHLSEGSFQVAGALAITAMLMGGVPDGCPCPVPDPEILWFAGSGMFENVYRSIEATLVLDVVEPVGEGAWRVEGSFSGTLAYIERVGTEPDEDRTVQVSGTFAVNPMILEADAE